MWLISLTNDLKTSSARAILEESRKRIHETNLDAYLEVILKANPRTFLEVRKMSDANMTFEEVFTQAGVIPQWIEKGIEKGKEEVARNLLTKGWTIKEISEITAIPEDKIRSLE